MAKSDFWIELLFRRDVKVKGQVPSAALENLKDELEGMLFEDKRDLTSGIVDALSHRGVGLVDLRCDNLVYGSTDSVWVYVKDSAGNSGIIMIPYHVYLAKD